MFVSVAVEARDAGEVGAVVVVFGRGRGLAARGDIRDVGGAGVLRGDAAEDVGLLAAFGETEGVADVAAAEGG